MKKVVIFLAVIIVLFVAVGFLTKMQNEEKVSGDNPYGKDKLHPETIAQLDDPNYQNIILPEELEKKLDNKEDVTVYFFSPTCSHCQRTTPVVSPLAKDMKVDLVQYNLLEFENGWDKYLITQTPTIVQYKDGKEVNRITGYQDEDVFKQWFNENSL
ncbi:thioredoxin family protein [Bacillus sp. DTU_2020_1000418_1_SI_GHA_SEK_038]|uniref:thioredoxin family protein n=1 Tax=Bacillus sp. DTU_2020_1000418_1_SI_GHA_SEK_038 TaxID=3077585 RepID=UPI0028EAF034|nr:thioredoxin family protein [Bacillus sp. DTU_2020_1000418_1_SI_GHA_SEK_038]WNS76705.1 thioredoxin family protein [Bacillus sp. DTU_2020_1000418_1_SI_GHA_SEK_038]